MSTDYSQVFETARARIFHLLEDGDWHSWRQLRKVGGVRYSARVLELKREGYSINSKPSGDSEGKLYQMPSPVPGKPQTKQVKVFLPEKEVQQMVSHGTVSEEARIVLRDALGSFRHNRDKL